MLEPDESEFDAWLDEALTRVAVPKGLVARVKRSAPWTDAELDAMVRDVPVPVRLQRRLQRITRRSWDAQRIARLALAASLFIGLALAHLAGLLARLDAVVPRPVARPTLQHATTVELAAIEPPTIETSQPAPVEPTEWPLLQAQARQSSLKRMPELDTVEAWTPAVARGLPLAWQRGWIADRNADSPDPLLDATLYRWPVLTAHTPFDELPELHKVPPPTPQGVRPPLVAGFDLPFYIRAGVFPFVSPANLRLQASSMPLGVTCASYDLARRFIGDAELPPPGSVRVEEFLAALDYGFAKPKSEPLALSMAGGPSPFGNEGLRVAHGGETLRLLQVGVQAKELARAPHKPTHMVFAIDTSASMNWGGRLEAVVKAFRAFASQFQAGDRISLVTFGQSAQVLLDDLSTEQIERLPAALAGLEAHGPTNVGAGLRQAYTLAEHAPQAFRRRVVLLTDGLTEVDEASLGLLRQRIAAAAERGIALDVVDLAQEADQAQINSQLASFVAAGKGRRYHAADVSQVGWALAEVLSGLSQCVARDVRLTVSFNPTAVMEYRLFGHEAASVAGLMPATIECDFRSGQAATALFEVRLWPNNQSEVATAELTWRDAKSQATASTRQKITRSQFAGGLAQASLGLQAAAFAAEFAELLRDSPFARSSPNAGSLARSLDLLEQADSRLFGWPAFAEMASLARKAEKAKPFQRGPRR